jgi:hypothetical protein
MNQLPHSEHLPVNNLAACFNNTSATYKFYWLLSIIQSLESGKTIISKRELFAGMVSTAWYTVNYFHISFGKQDKLQRAIENIAVHENLTIDANKASVFERLVNSENIQTIRELSYFNNQVPHWFLSPWFPGENQQGIYRNSQEFHNKCLYAVHDSFIQVNLCWVNYFLENAVLIKDFCHWNLVMYLQGKNPSVPDIPNKIIKPALRSNLIKQRTQFWDIVIKELETVECIYTKNPLTLGNYAVEHYIPYNFVSHNLIWNLIPADTSFNCKKSDKLPPMDKYFTSFFSLQEKAIRIVREKQPRNKFLEEYLTVFSDIDEVDGISNVTLEKFRNRIQPLITIASNNGFEFLS